MNLIEKINSEKWIGLIANLILSSLLLLLFFGSVLKNPNTTYFSNSGDGLKSTFGSIYHLNYDTTYLRTDYMNYPFGESVFYTGGQPIITNTFKFLKNIGFDFSEYLLGIINCWMLFSIVLAALFIYLILRELKLPIFYSIIVSNIIAFMSPQMDRFGGHFNLAYVFFIPLMIYLFLLFYKNRKTSISILIGFTALYSLGTHAYFFGFFTFIILVFWMGVILTNKISFGSFKFTSLNIIIQFILPLFLFQLLIWSSGGFGGDRTSYPWGFFELTAEIQGVFLPINRAYGQFLNLKAVPWEGVSYIGMVGIIGFLSIFINRLVNYKFKNDKWSFLKITDHPFLNILFWASIIALLFSFGFPFISSLKNLYNYMGPLKSFRAPGRFAWLFFYSINIISFYILWHFYNQHKNLIANIIMIFALLWGTYDAYLNVKFQENYINNSIESLSDKENKLDINKWYHKINAVDYQAIIPLPYFHIGSENYWIEGSEEIKKQAFIASIKTGFPLTAVMMGRTSMIETMLNLQLMKEAYNSYDILDLWPNNKPLLVLIDKTAQLCKSENKIMQKAELLDFNDQLEIRKITRRDFEEILAENKERIKQEIEDKKLFTWGDLLSSDSILNFYYNGLGNISPCVSEIGKDCYSGSVVEKNIILETQLNMIDISQEYVVSLWIESMDKDMYPRSNLSVSLCNENNVTYYNEFQIRKKLSIIDSNGWGLIEFKIKFNQKTGKIKIEIENNLLTRGKLNVDEILIRPVGTDIYSLYNDIIYKNNRFYTNVH